MELSLTLRIESSRKGRTMSDWSKYAAGKMQQREQDKMMKDRKALHDKEVFDTWCPEVWKNTKKAIQQECNALSSEEGYRNLLVCEDKGQTFLAHRSDTGDSVTLTFDFPHRSISVTYSDKAIPASSVEFRLAAGDNGIYPTINTAPMAEPQIAQAVLESLLRIQR